MAIQEYQPHLEKLGITYPQYLVLMVLWETDSIAVSEITRRLILNTNTITLVLKRMEAQGIITRQRSEEDERKVIVTLTAKGKQLQLQSAISKLVSRDEVSGILGIAGSLEAITRVIVPTVGGYLIQQIGRWAPGVFSALVMVWVITFVYRRIVFPARGDHLAAKQETAHA